MLSLESVDAIFFVLGAGVFSAGAFAATRRYRLSYVTWVLLFIAIAAWLFNQASVAAVLMAVAAVLAFDNIRRLTRMPQEGSCEPARELNAQLVRRTDAGPVQSAMKKHGRKLSFGVSLFFLAVVFIGLGQLGAPWWLYVNVVALAVASWFTGCAAMDPALDKA